MFSQTPVDPNLTERAAPDKLCRLLLFVSQGPQWVPEDATLESRKRWWGPWLQPDVKMIDTLCNFK